MALNSRGHHIKIGVSPSLSQKRDIDDGSLFPAELRGEDSSDPLDPKKTMLGTVGVSLQLFRSVVGSIVALVAISGDAGSARNADETIAVIARNADTNHPSADLVDSALSDAFPSQNREGDIADSGLPKKVSCRADADFSYLDISEISRCVAGAGSIGIEDAGNIGDPEVVATADLYSAPARSAIVVATVGLVLTTFRANFVPAPFSDYESSLSAYIKPVFEIHKSWVTDLVIQPLPTPMPTTERLGHLSNGAESGPPRTAFGGSALSVRNPNVRHCSDRSSADPGRHLFGVKRRLWQERVGPIPTVYVGRSGYGAVRNYSGYKVSLPDLVRSSAPGMHLRGAIFSLRSTARSPVLEYLPETEACVEHSGIDGPDFCSDIPDDIQILSTRDWNLCWRLLLLEGHCHLTTECTDLGLYGCWWCWKVLVVLLVWMRRTVYGCVPRTQVFGSIA